MFFPRSSLAAVCLCLLTITGCSRSPEGYVQAGNQFFDTRKYEDADIQYRKALQKNPEFGEAHYRLGLTQLKQNKPIEAYRSLRKAVELTPANDAAKVELADLALVSYLAVASRPKQFYDIASRLSNELVTKDPNSFDGLRLKGSLAMIDRKPKQALEFFQKAHRIKPLDPNLIVDLTQALFQDNQNREGERWALELIERDKTYSPIYEILYSHYVTGQQLGEAENILKRKVENNPKHADYILQLARHYAATAKQKDMTVTLQRLLNNSSDFPSAQLQVGDFYSKLGNWDEALRLWQACAAANSKDKPMCQKGIVNALLAQRKTEEARNLVELILKDHPADPDALAVRASIRMGSRDTSQLDAAIVEFESALKQRPDNPDFRFNLGRAYQAKGKLNEARREYQEVIRRQRNHIPARLALADLSLIQQKPQETLQSADSVLSYAPRHAPARLLRAAALAALGDLKQARADLIRLTKDVPQYRDAQVQLGLVAIRQKSFQEAQEIFRNLHRTDPNDLRATIGLVEIFSSQQELDKALELLQQDLKKSPNSLVIRNLLGMTALRARNYDLAIEQYKQLASAEPNSIQPLLSLGDAYRFKGDLNSAIVTFEKAKQIAPKDGVPPTLLANALQRAGRLEDAKTNYRRALQLSPNQPGALNNLAYLLAETDDNMDEALRLAQRASQQLPDEPGIADTLGWVYLKKKMPDPALQIFSNLVKKSPDNSTFHYHLGAALAAKGDKEKARAALNTALSKRPAKDEEAKIKELLTRLG